ncbi:MAG: MFS transporter [Bacteroidetes bacterium]|nr:MFS transporter [Bacteroidota bacterium]
MSNDNKHNFEPVYNDLNLRIIFLITLMAVLGVASITPAFPKISNELKIQANSVGLLIIIFTLPGIILTPVLGVMADRFGRKKVIIPSLILFGLAGTGCFFVRDFNHLLVLRFFQGVGAASIGSLNITLIGDIYEKKERTNAMGYNASLISIATASYPVIGGILASIAWYYPFALPVFALPIAFIVFFKLNNPEPVVRPELKKYFKNIFGSIKTKAALLYFFSSLVTFILLYGSFLTYFPFLLNEKFNASPLGIGVLMSTMSIVTGITSSQLGRLTDRYSKKTLLKISFLLYTIALVLFPQIETIWLLIIPTAIFGSAQGINIPSVQILLTEIAPLEHRAAFMSFNGMVLRLGQTLGPLIMGGMFIFIGIDATFYTGGVIAILNFILLVTFL